MSSREIKHLSHDMQVLFNKFHDKVRRDTELQRLDVAILLTCTHRGGRGKDKINRMPSEAFEIVVLHDGRVTPFIPPEIVNHASQAGLKYDGSNGFEKREG